MVYHLINVVNSSNIVVNKNIYCLSIWLILKPLRCNNIWFPYINDVFKILVTVCAKTKGLFCWDRGFWRHGEGWQQPALPPLMVAPGCGHSENSRGESLKPTWVFSKPDLTQFCKDKNIWDSRAFSGRLLFYYVQMWTKSGNTVNFK